MRVAIPREIVPDENRVALVPEAVGTLIKAGTEGGQEEEKVFR